jgi:hypothetical protein
MPRNIIPINKWNDIGNTHWATIITWFRGFFAAFGVDKGSELMKKVEKEMNRASNVLHVDVDLQLEFSPNDQYIIEKMRDKFVQDPDTYLYYRPHFCRKQFCLNNVTE